jgi:hypothetical protein
VADAAKDESLVACAREHAVRVLGDFLTARRWQLMVKWEKN